MKNPWRWPALVSGGHLLVDLYGNMVISILPFIAITWNLSSVQLAFLVLMQAVTGQFLQPFLGIYIDAHPQRMSLVVSIVIMALPMSFLYLAVNYASFVALVTIAGLGYAIFHPLGAIKILEGADGEAALKMSLYSGLGNLGYSVSPAITGFIIYHLTMKGLLLYLLPAALWLILFRLIKSAGEDVKREKEKGDVRQDKKKVRQEKAKDEGSRDFRFLRNKPFLFLGALVFFRAWMTQAIQVFVPTWLVLQGSSEGMAGLYITGYLLAGTVGGFLFGALYNRVPWYYMMASSFFIAIIATCLYFNAGPAARVFLLMVLGFVLIGTIPITIIVGQELLPAREAFATGVMIGFANGLGAIGNLITGIMVDERGTGFALIATFLFLVPCIFISLRFRKSAGGRTEP